MVVEESSSRRQWLLNRNHMAGALQVGDSRQAQGGIERGATNLETWTLDTNGLELWFKCLVIHLCEALWYMWCSVPTTRITLTGNGLPVCLPAPRHRDDCLKSVLFCPVKLTRLRSTSSVHCPLFANPCSFLLVIGFSLVAYSG